jgi:hypothetical protein
MSCKVLRAAPTFGRHVKDGMGALKGGHHRKVEMEATCSVDLDAHGPRRGDGEKRWDYVLVNHDGKGHGVEVHPGWTSNVEEMIEKKRWAEQVLAREAKKLVVAKWHWIATGKVDIRKHDRARKRLVEAGVEFPRKHIAIP